MNTTLKQRCPRTRYVLTLTIALLVQLFNACSVIGQDDAGENAVADNAATPGLELNDDAKPSLNDLIDRLAAIEKSYRRFSIRWHETFETNPDLPAEFKPLWPNRPERLLKYTQSQIGPREWVDHGESYTNGVRTNWSQRFATEKGILSTNDKQLTSASEMRFDAEGRNEFLIPAPFEGIYALHDAGLQRSLLSQRIQDNLGRTSLEWIDDDAKLTIRFEDGPIRPRRVEVWLSHKHNWHPIRVRWFHPTSSKNVPFRHEWEVTVFTEASDGFRVKSGVQRFPLDLRSMSDTSNIAAYERFKKLANESEQRNETLPIAYTKAWKIDAATYGDDVKTPLTWIEVDEDPLPLKERQSEAMKESAATEIPVAVAGVVNDDISALIIPLAIELGELRTKLGSNHPKVVSLEAKLVAIRDLAKQKTHDTPAVPDADNEQLKIFNLNNSQATEAAEIIDRFYGSPSVTIAIDDRTNAVVVRADESLLREIEAVLLKLDSTETAAKKSETTNQPAIDANEPVTSIAEYRRQLDTLEEPVLQLAEQVRAAETKLGKDHPDSAKLRADLRVAVQTTFAARQEIQRAELAEFTRRLQRMQQSIDSRERIIDRIVDRRIEELLDPNLNWTQSQGGQSESASKASSKPQKPVSIGQIGDDVQDVSLTMFEVTDANFMKGREFNADPSVAPMDLDVQLKKMLESRTAEMLGSHKVKTILNQTSTSHSGGTFEVPSSDSESKRDVKFGTRIRVTPRMIGGEKVFEIVWNEQLVDRNNIVNGIPGINEKQWRMVVKSPSPGGTGYLSGPFAGSGSGSRRFISFFLYGADEAIQ